MVLRPQLVYLILALVTMAAGLASRWYDSNLPVWYAKYGGDTLWALMVYLLVSMVFVGRPFELSFQQRLVLALGFAFGIEFSQLYQASWINSLRETRLGGLVLGYGFLWTDLVCYSVGIAVGGAADWWFERKASKAIHEQ